MVLKDIAFYVEVSISSDYVELEQYITTDNILQNKEGRSMAANLPPQSCGLTHYLPGDILIANIRPYLKKVWKANIEGGCSKDVLVIRAKENHYSDYLYAITLQDVFFENAMLGNKGTQMPRGDKDKIMEFPVFEHAKEDERKIGDFINKLQNKISLNTRLNAELEAMAKQLYDYWFVQFDFPNENGKPYKTSGGKMVYDEKLKREIPEGWEVKELNDLVKTPKESIAPFDYPEVIYKHYSIPAYDACGSYMLEKGDTIQSNKFVVNKGQILVPKLNPWYNRVVLVDKSENSICSTEYVILDSVEDGNRGFLYYSVKTDSFISYCTKGSTGTSHSQRRVSPEIIKAYKVPYNKDVMAKYSAITTPALHEKNEKLEQIRQLTQLRDSLLPMLMNGQVTIE